MSKTTLFWLLCSLALFTLAGCTMAEVSATTAAVGAGVLGIVKALQPVLTPEQAAALSTAAARIDGTAEATATAVQVIAETIHTMRTAVEANQTSTAEALTKASAAIAGLPTTNDVLVTSGLMSGGAAGAVNAYRSATRGAVLAKLPKVS